MIAACFVLASFVVVAALVLVFFDRLGKAEAEVAAARRGRP